MRFIFRLLSLTMAWLLATSALGPVALAQRIGDYDSITRYSGFRNFISNPSAQFNPIGVTLSNATATRSTTTPLGEGGTEWNVTITSANGTIDFTTSGATTANLGGAMCEATADVRGFQATSRIQVFDGTNVLYTDTFGAKTNREKVGFIGFPCPSDPSTLRIRFTDTATLAATNEVANVYLGKSRNIGDAANITAWTSYTPTISGLGSGTTTAVAGYYRRIGDSLEAEVKWSTNSVGTGASIVQASLPSGLTIDTTKAAGVNNNGEDNYGSFEFFTGSAFSAQAKVAGSGTSTAVSFLKPGTAGYYTGADFVASSKGSARFTVPIANWPTASSAVTPSIQNVWGAVRHDPTVSISLHGGVAEPTGFSTFTGATVASSRALLGSCTAPSTANDLGCQITLPPGSFRVSYRGYTFANPDANSSVACSFRIRETTTSTTVGFQSNQNRADANAYALNNIVVNGIFTNTAQAARNFIIQAEKNTDTSGANNSNCAFTTTAVANAQAGDFFLSVEPLERNTTPVYVRSPVTTNGTGTVPSTGEVGEQVRSIQTTSTNFPATNTYGDCTSISLTPGVWDISMLGYATLNAATMTAWNIAISPNSGTSSSGITFPDNVAVSLPPSSTTDTTTTIPQYRVSLSSTTTYYGKVRATYSSGTPQYLCRISAVRVGDR